MTNHAQTQVSWCGLPNALKKLAYGNDLKSLIYEYNINAWFHGHTHSVVDYRIADTRFLSNTRGYTGRRLVTGFDMHKPVAVLRESFKKVYAVYLEKSQSFDQPQKLVINGRVKVIICRV